MRIFIFKSASGGNLRAFAGDSSGSKLPKQHGPWTPVGVVAEGRNPPHGFPRRAIEDAIGKSGFQLWRMKDDRKSA